LTIYSAPRGGRCGWFPRHRRLGRHTFGPAHHAGGANKGAPPQLALQQPRNVKLGERTKRSRWPLPTDPARSGARNGIGPTSITASRPRRLGVACRPRLLSQLSWDPRLGPKWMSSATRNPEPQLPAALPSPRSQRDAIRWSLVRSCHADGQGPCLKSSGIPPLGGELYQGLEKNGNSKRQRV